MAIWTIAKKESRILLRDVRAWLILLAMPILFIFVLGLSLGEGLFQKPDDRLRVSVIDLDQGYLPTLSASVAGTAGLLASPSGHGPILAASTVASGKTWSALMELQAVGHDLVLLAASTAAL